VSDEQPAWAKGIEERIVAGIDVRQDRLLVAITKMINDGEGRLGQRLDNLRADMKAGFERLHLALTEQP
jgi:hypothetical protein